MAPPFSLRILFRRILFRQIQRRREVHGGLSCEIVSDLCPNPFSHDWHVQPSCQRPNRLPPERRAFRSRRTRLCGRTHKSESGCPRNPSNISFAPNPVNASIPQHFHVISTLGMLRTRRRGAQKLNTARNDIAFRSGFLQRRRFLSACRSGRQKIEKRSLVGGPCFEGTLQKPTRCFRIRSRGRDD